MVSGWQVDTHVTLTPNRSAYRLLPYGEVTANHEDVTKGNTQSQLALSLEGALEIATSVSFRRVST